MLESRRRKMKIGTQPKQILLRVKPEIYHKLHARATENNRSLNFECNEILSAALEKTKGATTVT